MLMQLRWMMGGLARTAALVALGLVAVAAITAVNTDTAEARRRQAHHSTSASKKFNTIRAGRAHPARFARRARLVQAEVGAGNPLYSAVVVDVNSGRTLYESAADGLRHPASITKVMTLYMLFEQLEAGRLTLNSPLPVSAYAAAQAPTKLGLHTGDTLRVEDAINGMVTRSANDAAVAVAEALGGSEANFAAMMTRKARSLGMTRTVYRNASGLPDPGQITTARDLAILGIAVQDRFPRYYRYFATRSFVYRGRGIANHNRLLGNVEGVDGIKTGYTRASGFNLLTSVRRGERQLVAVIMGGRSGGSRDASMRQLIDAWMPRAYAGNRQTRSLLADASSAPAPLPKPFLSEAPAEPSDEEPVIDEAAAMEPQPAPAPARPSQPPRIRPAVVAETPKPKANAPVAAPIRLAAFRLPSAPVELRPRPLEGAKPAVASTSEGGPVLRWIQGPAPVTAPATPPARTAQSMPAPARGPESTATVQLVRTKTFLVQEETDTVSEVRPPAEPVKAAAAPPATAEPSAVGRTGWIIQIGAADSESAAKKLLDRARSTGHRAITSAEPFTESVERNGSKLWRARFAGFLDQRQAQAACAALKSKDFACLAVRL
jgi:D-alanyl-D-alanine carboxypeptidase